MRPDVAKYCASLPFERVFEIEPVSVARSRQAAHKLKCYYIELMKSSTVSGYNQLLGFPQQNSRYGYLHRRGRL